MLVRVLAAAALGAGAVVGVAAIALAPGILVGATVIGMVAGLLAAAWLRGVLEGGPASRATVARGGMLAAGAATACSIVVALWWRHRAGPTNLWHDVRERAMRDARRPATPRPVAPCATAPPDPLPATPGPATLSTARLCLAWQHTCVASLDESERRNPEGFTRWLDTGAHPGSNPARYLAEDR